MKRIRVIHDIDASSPREDDNIGTIACWHRRYKLGDVQPEETPQEYIDSLQKTSIILPLYLYDHSGITISTSPFSCPWDSGQVGIIHVSPQKIREEFGAGAKAREQAIKRLQAEVEVYDQFLRGDVYGFVIEDGSVCDHGDTHWEVEDSCWGFYGADPMTNGMSYYVPAELHDLLKQAAARPEYR